MGSSGQAGKFTPVCASRGPGRFPRHLAPVRPTRTCASRPRPATRARPGACVPRKRMRRRPCQATRRIARPRLHRRPPSRAPFHPPTRAAQARRGEVLERLVGALDGAAAVVQRRCMGQGRARRFERSRPNRQRRRGKGPRPTSMTRAGLYASTWSRARYWCRHACARSRCAARCFKRRGDLPIRSSVS